MREILHTKVDIRQAVLLRELKDLRFGFDLEYHFDERNEYGQDLGTN